MNHVYEFIERMGRQFGLPPGLLLMMAYQENGRKWNFDLNAKSYKGAAGLMQIMPITVQEIVRLTGTLINPMNWQHSAWGAAAYMNWLYRRFGSWRVAAAAYNYGYGNIRANLARNGGRLNVNELPAETRNYLYVTDTLGLS